MSKVKAKKLAYASNLLLNSKFLHAVCLISLHKDLKVKQKYIPDSERGTAVCNFLI